MPSVGVVHVASYDAVVSVPISVQLPVAQLAPTVLLNSKSTALTPVPVSLAVAASVLVGVVTYEPSAGSVRETAGEVVSTIHPKLAIGPVAVTLTARTSKVCGPVGRPEKLVEPLPVPGQVAKAAPSRRHSNVAAASLAL